MRVAVPAIVSLLVLSGCALPPAVSVASLVADGVSYAATGKSTTDHAISAVARQDCALLRLAQGEELCDPEGEALIELVGADASPDDWADPEEARLADDGTDTSQNAAGEIARADSTF